MHAHACICMHACICIWGPWARPRALANKNARGMALPERFVGCISTNPPQIHMKWFEVRQMANRSRQTGRHREADHVGPFWGQTKHKFAQKLPIDRPAARYAGMHACMHARMHACMYYILRWLGWVVKIHQFSIACSFVHGATVSQYTNPQLLDESPTTRQIPNY